MFIPKTPVPNGLCQQSLLQRALPKKSLPQESLSKEVSLSKEPFPNMALPHGLLKKTELKESLPQEALPKEVALPKDPRRSERDSSERVVSVCNESLSKSRIRRGDAQEMVQYGSYVTWVVYV